MDNQENERVFEPLFLALARTSLSAPEREHVIGNYMFMYEDKERGVFAYKHSWTRRYVYLNEVGTVQDSEIDNGTYSINSILKDG